MTTILFFLVDTLHYTPGLIVLIVLIGFIWRGKDLQRIRLALAQVRGLVLYGQRTMVNGKMNDAEWKELINRIGEIVKAGV